jgi:hypothetical protein
MPRFKNVSGVDIQFTPEEELERDAEEAQWEIDKVALLEKEEEKSTLEAKLADDSITFEEMKELMRLRG